MQKGAPNFSNNIDCEGRTAPCSRKRNERGAQASGLMSIGRTWTRGECFSKEKKILRWEAQGNPLRPCQKELLKNLEG